MSEWWTYRLSDFLMFSPRIYWRLVERYNGEIWPAQLLAAGAGLLLLKLAATRSTAAARVTAALLAAAWLWVGWAFFWQRYATINWAASYFAFAFWLEALLLVVLGTWQRGPRERAHSSGVRALGWALAAVGLLFYPLAGPVAGRPWTQAEVFGVMPDPTALATVGLLLTGSPPHAGWLGVVPVLSLMVGMPTLWMLST